MTSEIDRKQVISWLRPKSQFDVTPDADVSQEPDPLAAYLKDLDSQTTGAKNGVLQAGRPDVENPNIENPDTSLAESYEPRERSLKGSVKYVFTKKTANQLSEKAIDCRGYNRLSVFVFVSGTTPSATISVEGAAEEGANTLALPDSNASQSGVTADKAFDCIVGTRWARVRIASISGTFAAGQGYTIICTPYIG